MPYNGLRKLEQWLGRVWNTIIESMLSISAADMDTQCGSEYTAVSCLHLKNMTEYKRVTKMAFFQMIIRCRV